MANAGNLLTNIAIPTVTTSVAQGENPYPLQVVTLTLTGLQASSDIVILAAGTETVLTSVDANVGTTYNYVYETPVPVDIGVFKAGFIPLYVRGLVLTSSNASLPLSQTIDRAYLE